MLFVERGVDDEICPQPLYQSSDHLQKPHHRGAGFPDPYDWLTLNLSSHASNNNGQWSNAQFDQLVKKAEQTSDQNARLQLYNQAEQIAVSDVGWLPIDHQELAAIIPNWIHGLTLSGNGLYFGDWSDVYILQH